MFKVKYQVNHITGQAGDQKSKQAELPCLLLLAGISVLSPLTIPTLGRNPTARPMMCLLFSQLWPFAYNPTSSM